MIVDFIFSILLGIIHVILLPIDLMLSNFPSLEAIPSALHAVFSMVGDVPTTMLYLTGGSPVLWNIIFIVSTAYFAAMPTINGFKKVWAWVH